MERNCTSQQDENVTVLIRGIQKSLFGHTTRISRQSLPRGFSAKLPSCFRSNTGLWKIQVKPAKKAPMVLSSQPSIRLGASLHGQRSLRNCLLVEQNRDELPQGLPRLAEGVRETRIWDCNLRSLILSRACTILVRACTLLALPKAHMAIHAACSIPAAPLPSHISAWGTTLVRMAPRAS